MPYPNEHACRLNEPGKYKEFRRKSRKSSSGKIYDVIFGIFNRGGKSVSEEQAYRYPKKSWSASEAKAHCREHDGRFEAAIQEMDLKDILPDMEE
jgi:hypothetical protein